MSALALSVVVNTKNSEDTLAKALESVTEIAKQIVVMDMHSQDKTTQIARKFTSEVYKSEKDFEYVEPARNAALAKATQPWILILDADEELSSGLKKEIKEIIQAQSAEAECYYVPRKNIIFGREMTGTGWWPDYQMRFFKKDKVEWSSQIHSVPEIHGKVAYLPADADKAIIHHNFQKVDQFIDRLNRYTTIEAETGETQELTSELTSAAALKIFQDEFVRRLFQQKGIDEGVHGVSLSLLQSTYQLSVALKKWEKQGFPSNKIDQKMSIHALRNFQKDLNYWIADWQVANNLGPAKLVWQIRRKLRW